MEEIIVIEIPELSNGYEKRYAICNRQTGEIIDDAQGYGYKTIKKAYAAYTYKNRDKSKDDQLRAKERQIRTWMKENPSFIELIIMYDFEIAKGQFGDDVKFNAALVKKLLKENGHSPNFTAGDLLKVLRKK